MLDGPSLRVFPLQQGQQSIQSLFLNAPFALIEKTSVVIFCPVFLSRKCRQSSETSVANQTLARSSTAPSLRCCAVLAVCRPFVSCSRLAHTHTHTHTAHVSLIHTHTHCSRLAHTHTHTHTSIVYLAQAGHSRLSVGTACDSLRSFGSTKAGKFFLPGRRQFVTALCIALEVFSLLLSVSLLFSLLSLRLTSVSVLCAVCWVAS